MQYNQSQAPYYDDYDPSKGYIQHLAVPERVEQAREFNQIQSISLDHISRLGSAVFKEGAIIEGCTLSINETEVSITSGRIFLGGLIRLVDGTVVHIEGVGTEHITAKIVTDIVDETDDPSLVDPAVGYLNYNQPGAHRLRQVVKLGVDDSDGISIYTLKDGDILNESKNTENTVLNDTLARRTYDESGNFKVNGLNLMEREGDNLAISITEGKAYIKGYEVTKSTMTTLAVSPTDAVETIRSEPKLFTLASDLYELNYSPVSRVLDILAQVRVTEERVTRLAPAGGYDALQHSPVVTIDSVFATSGSETTLYVQNRDYILSADSIDWSLNVSGSIEPEVGTSYFVTYTYNRHLVEGTDYQLIEQNGRYFIKFLSAGNLPVVGSRVSITYEAYLARRDLVLLDKSGEFSIIEGKSDRIDRLITPYNQDEDKLELGYIEILPNSQGLTYVSYKTVRLTQPEIYSLSRRIDDIEYNQALQDLDNEAEAGESATELKGIYTDGFIGFSKCDLTHPEFNCCIDYESEEMTLPVESINSTDLVINPQSVISRLGRVISAPYQNKLVLRQPYASGTMLVNPYAAYNPMSVVKLNPALDNWVDTNSVRVYDTDSKTLYNTTYSTINRAVSKRVVRGGHFSAYTTTSTSSSTTSTTSQSSSTSTQISNQVSESMIEYMRVRTIVVSGSAFESGQDNIECYFNDTRVALTPVGSTEAGTNAGTVRADSSGKLTAKFVIPAKSPCGTASVKLVGSVSSGIAEYTAQGILRTKTTRETQVTTNTITTNYVTTITTTTTQVVDPLAQSFVFPEDTVLTKVGLYFSAKDASRPVMIQIRNMVNGYPGTICYAETILDSVSVKTSSNSSAVTEVTFNQPIYCKANEFYCVVILSDSNAYEMHYSELSSRDILTGKYISSQPYAAGVLFSSSNASTWTAHQACDLKFDLYAAEYVSNGSVVFEEVETSEFNRLMLVADYLDYKNSGIDWKYRCKSNSGIWSDWMNIDTYLERSTDENSKNIQVKADLKVSHNTSPMIAEDCANLVTMSDGATATYVSKTIFMSEPYTKLKIACQLYLPSGLAACGYRIYYSTDSGDNWTQISNSPDISRVSEDFYEYIWDLNSIEGGSATSYKIKIELWTNNVAFRPRARKLRSILKY